MFHVSQTILHGAYERPYHRPSKTSRVFQWRPKPGCDSVEEYYVSTLSSVQNCWDLVDGYT